MGELIKSLGEHTLGSYDEMRSQTIPEILDSIFFLLSEVLG